MGVYPRSPFQTTMASVALPPLPPLPEGLEYCIVARRNDSLRRRGRWLAFGVLAAVSLVLATAFAVVGAWPVLPWSALELSLLACAFVHFERSAGDWERLAVAGDRVIVERATRGVRELREFNRFWLRVELDRSAPGAAPRVRLWSGGTAWEFGDALPVSERIAVARELRQLTGTR